MTALWAEDFSHIRYGVKEVFWNADNLIDLGELRAGRSGAGYTKRNPGRSRSDAAARIHIGMAESSIESTKIMRPSMIIEMKPRSRTQDVLDILGIILINLENSKDFEEILNYLREEFFDTLQLGELDFTLKLLKNLHSIRQKLNQHSSGPLRFSKFFSALCRESTLAVLRHVWPTIGPENAEKQKLVLDILTMLPSRAISALIPMMLECHPLHIHDLMMDIVVHLARRNSNPLKKLLTNSNEAIVALSLKVLSMLNQPENVDIFLNMTRHDWKISENRLLPICWPVKVTIGDVCISLIDDSSNAVRWLALKHLGQTRNSRAEKLLTTLS